MNGWLSRSFFHETIEEVENFQGADIVQQLDERNRKRRKEWEEENKLIEK